ncbi:MAG TPA: hypothetical protein VKU90_08410 [Caulobacteraceae bacterium]|nr:hypothetical protein [Caulobacteraceae bacterium]
MTEHGAAPAETAPAPAPATGAPSSRLWRTNRGGPLKLVRGLRGKGALVWSGGEIAAAYEIDIFSRGAMFTVSGRIQGDFSALAGGRPSGLRLRLQDDHEIAVNLISLTRAAAEFDAPSPAAETLMA